jgi:hypothetical protein
MSGKIGKLWENGTSFPIIFDLRMEEEKTQLGKPSSGWENNTRRIIMKFGVWI